MAESIKDSIGQAFLNYLLRAGTVTTITNAYIQLHTGAPGAAGTTNPAGNQVRKLITCSAATTSSGIATITNTSSFDWTAPLGTAETYSKFSVWDNATFGSGAFLFSGSLTIPVTVAATIDTFSIPIGGLIASFAVAS